MNKIDKSFPCFFTIEVKMSIFVKEESIFFMGRISGFC